MTPSATVATVASLQINNKTDIKQKYFIYCAKSNLPDLFLPFCDASYFTINIGNVIIKNVNCLEGDLKLTSDDNFMMCDILDQYLFACFQTPSSYLKKISILWRKTY